MSRTYRKSSVTEQESLVKYVNNRIAYATRRSYGYEYILTDAGQKAYDKAMEEYENEYYRWLHSGWQPVWKTPAQPNIWDFKKARVVYSEVDVDKEVKEATEEYKKYKRDGRFYDGDLNRSYKKHCASDLRRLNRDLARKIIKDDDSWEQKPYPDTYLGKQYVWDYW